MKLFCPVLLAAALLAAAPLRAQTPEEAIRATINQFFEAMESGDTTALRAACAPAPILQTYGQDRQGQWRVRTDDFNDFVRMVGSPSGNTFDEQIEFASIQVEAALASVWTPYRFFLNGALSHCGTNSFQLVLLPEGWKIQYIIDTRRRDCE
ncbi:MAG: nuclear transport factor 2 family protein [Saprospiraceae bacterium]|nr:nuclear transport factor 2 family protein [Saprospiraceae bacterium]